MRNRRRSWSFVAAFSVAIGLAVAGALALPAFAQIADPPNKPSTDIPSASPPGLPAATPPTAGPTPATAPPAADTAPDIGKPGSVPPPVAAPNTPVTPSTPPPGSQSSDKPSGDRPVGDRLVRIGTNAVSGLYFPAGGAICRMLARARENANLRCLVDSTNGSTANVRGLRGGDLEFGIVQSDWQYYAVQGSGAFKSQGPVKELRAVFSLYPESFTVIVRKDGGIKSFEQIKGKRIAVGPAGSGQRILFDALIAAQGWRQQDAGILSDASDNAAVGAFCNGVVDVVVLMTHHPAPLVQDMMGRCAGTFLPVTGAAVAKVLKDRPYYALAAIAVDGYPVLTREVPTLGVRATLVTVERVPDDIVYALVKAVFENFDLFVAQHPGLAGLKREDMVKAALSAPLHEGAKRYFREKGLIP